MAESKCFGDIDWQGMLVPARDAESRKWAWQRSQDEYDAFLKRDAAQDLD